MPTIPEEVRRTRQLLSQLVRGAGLTRAEIDARLGEGRGYSTRILDGLVGLKHEHTLSLLKAVGVDPGDFFRLLYPRSEKRIDGGSLGPLLVRMNQMVDPQESAEALPAATAASSARLDPDDLGRRRTLEEEGGTMMQNVEEGGPLDRKHLQQFIRHLAENEGYRVEVEVPIPDGMGSVDLALYHGEEESIACLISVASTVEEPEVGYLLACLRAGFSWVVLLSRDKRMARKMGRRLRELAPESDLGRFNVMPPEEFVAHLKIPPAEPGVEDSRYGKYRVRVRYRQVDPADAEARARALSEVIGKSLRRTLRRMSAQ